ncbi:MAG TPA: hypothetical protein ENK50_11330 [Sedimenticola sp.]|nr:hypothetical protein [Sedimenticola sp.]
MLEYIFFDPRPWERFAGFVRELGLKPELSDQEQGFLVCLPDDTDDALMDRIEAFYDEMLDLNERLFNEQEAQAGVHRAGVSVNLGDGRTVQAAVEPALLNRLLEVVSTEELGQFVNAIVDAVENPDERPFCQRDGG